MGAVRSGLDRRLHVVVHYDEGSEGVQHPHEAESLPDQFAMRGGLVPDLDDSHARLDRLHAHPLEPSRPREHRVGDQIDAEGFPQACDFCQCSLSSLREARASSRFGTKVPGP